MSVKGGEGGTPQIRNFFLAKILSVKGGGGYPPYGQNLQSSIWPPPLMRSRLVNFSFQLKYDKTIPNLIVQQEMDFIWYYLFKREHEEEEKNYLKFWIYKFDAIF